MSEVINSKVFDVNKKFVDFAGLDYFWEKAKTYIDGVDTTMSAKVLANENAIKGILEELESLSGGVGSVGTQINNAIAALDLPNTYEAKGAAADALSEAKTYADGKDSAMNTRVAALEAVDHDAYKAADTALETSLKAYADQAEADALSEAKSYADGKDSAMDARVKVLEAVDHETLAADAATAAINDFASKVSNDDVVNTFKELVDYAAEHGSEFTSLVGEVTAIDGRVKVLEAVDHDAYKAADVQVLEEAKSYADGKDSAMDARVKVLEAVDHDAYKAADTALETSLKAYADQAEADALSAAKTYADGKDSAMNTRVAALEAIDHDAYKAADTALETSLKAYADQAETDAVAAAVAQAKLDAAEALKAYYSKTEVDNLLSTNSSADQGYAKAYTDALFDSIKFAANSDIDSLFA